MSRNSKKERQSWLAAVGQAVREFRIQMGVSQEELGYKAGFHRTYVSGLERGQLNATAWTLRRLAKTMGTTPSGIFQRAEELDEEI